jgi:DNA-binding PadR family transcriptional regulator
MSGVEPGESGIAVNEHEGTVLGMVARWQPLTRYQLLKAFERSPISAYNTSKGSLYPLVGRMIIRGFLVTETSGGPRESELISLSDLGRQALHRGIVKIGSQHSMVNDPLQVRIRARCERAREERLRWVVSAKDLLIGKKEELKDYHERLTVPFNDIVYNFGVAAIDAKLRWLDRLMVQLVDDREPDGRVVYSGEGDGEGKTRNGDNENL